eukprot:TRINITY_DN12558_c8_g4_i1.p1 TRINITY_DN12558_c8_g4~~TRINITY_DN12558_c8_g4_i1.p1  ORF type:complete len:132 (+),score=14.94 TRINITY_DN12558_c8_g4_i1:97-492(+)
MASATRYGRYICQLRKLNITYCKGGGSSAGMREFIEHTLPGLAAANPQTIFEVRHRGGRHPALVGEFLNGATKKVCVKNYHPDGVESFAMRLLREDGHKVKKEAHGTKTNRPTIQGNWNPFLHEQTKASAE